MKNLLQILLLSGCVALVAGCPYVPTVQQGNSLTQAQVSQLRIGMSKTEVRSLLGTPVLNNAFSDNTWTYVSTLQINGGKIVKHKVELQFSNGRLVRIIN